MSAFIPSEIVPSVMLSRIQKQLVAADVINHSYEGMLKKAGDSFKIPSLSGIAVGDYTRNQTLTWSAVGGSSQVLTINQEKYITLHLDAIDNEQSAIAVSNDVFGQMSYEVANDADSYLLSGYYPSVDGTNSGGSGARALGTSGTAISVYNIETETTGSGALAYLGRMAQILDEENCPQADRFAIVPPWFSSYLVQEKCLTAPSVEGEAAYQNGRVGRAMGFDIRTSTNLINYNTTASHIYAGHKSAVEYAGSMVEASIFPMREVKFGEGFAILYVYGALVVRPTFLCKGFVTQA